MKQLDELVKNLEQKLNEENARRISLERECEESKKRESDLKSRMLTVSLIITKNKLQNECVIQERVSKEMVDRFERDIEKFAQVLETPNDVDFSITRDTSDPASLANCVATFASKLIKFTIEVLN